MSCLDIVRDHLDLVRPKQFGANHYGEQHYQAWKRPRDNFESGLRDLIVGLAAYADAYPKKFESHVGQDGGIGDYWLEALKSVKRMLTGEIGRFNAGTLDELLTAIALEAKCDPREVGVG